jgi:hypothetical protein
MSSSAAALDESINQTQMSAMLGENSLAVRMATSTKAPPLAVLRSAQMLISPQEKVAFAGLLICRLRSAGVDTSEAIQFEIDGRGRVRAKDGTPGKSKIDAVFAADPGLGNDYRRIANNEELKAQVREMSRYTFANAAASGEGERETLSRHYSAIFASMMAVRGQMILTDGTLESLAFDFVSAPISDPFDRLAAAGLAHEVA